MDQFTTIRTDINEDVFAYQASLENEIEIMKLIIDTASWLKSKGLTQWDALLQGQDSHNIPGAIRRGEVFAFKSRDLGELVGVVILQQKPSEWDYNLWGIDDPFHDSSIYLHRLAVSRHYGGKGLGRLIVEWAWDGVLFPNKDRIRLDCIEHNDHLNQFYSNCGYTHRGIHDGFSKYEKMLSLK